MEIGDLAVTSNAFASLLLRCCLFVEMGWFVVVVVVSVFCLFVFCFVFVIVIVFVIVFVFLKPWYKLFR